MKGGRMADEKLVAMLKSEGGVEKFNEWRKVNPTTKIDLTGANLSRLDLSDADLSRADMRGADLSESGLSDIDLSGANLRGAALSEANLTRAYLYKADLSEADLSGADLSKSALRDVAGLDSACFRGATLELKAQAVILAAVAESFTDL